MIYVPNDYDTGYRAARLAGERQERRLVERIEELERENKELREKLNVANLQVKAKRWT